MLHKLFHVNSAFGIDLEKLRNELTAFGRDPFGNDVSTGFDFPVQIGNVVVVEGQITAQQSVKQHTFVDRVEVLNTSQIELGETKSFRSLAYLTSAYPWTTNRPRRPDTPDH